MNALRKSERGERVNLFWISHKPFVALFLCASTVISFTGNVDNSENGTPEYDIESIWGQAFCVFAEGALSIGGLRHNFNEDYQEQFGYNFREGCEQDGAYFRLGVGRGFGAYGGYLYGEVGYFGPGVIFDNHGPFIPPEILLRVTELSMGAELRAYLGRLRVGFGRYTGSAKVQLDYDTTQVINPDSWDTDLVGSSGWHYAVGLVGRTQKGLVLGIEWIQHFFSVKLERNGLGTEPTEHDAKQSEFRFFAGYEFSI